MEQTRRLKELTGYSLKARDGELGTLEEIYFEDRHWVVRYFVVRTGSWLLGKEVLIMPGDVNAVDEKEKRIAVGLTRKQVKDAPPVDTKKPVSRHYETELYLYYSRVPYWSGDPMLGGGPVVPPAPPELPAAAAEPEEPHLRSSREVRGYGVRAGDEQVGHVEDFILEEPGWAVRYLEVDSGRWLPDRRVLVAPAWISGIDWASGMAEIDMEPEKIRSAPEYDPKKVISRDYQVALFAHYGKQFEGQ